MDRIKCYIKAPRPILETEGEKDYRDAQNSKYEIMRYEIRRKKISFCVLLLVCCMNISSCCCIQETSRYLEMNVYEQIKYERLIQ